MAVQSTQPQPKRRNTLFCENRCIIRNFQPQWLKFLKDITESMQNLTYDYWYGDKTFILTAKMLRVLRVCFSTVNYKARTEEQNNMKHFTLSKKHASKHFFFSFYCWTSIVDASLNTDNRCKRNYSHKSFKGSLPLVSLPHRKVILDNIHEKHNGVLNST